MISIIAAAAENGTIGLNGAIPWDIPQDRKYFRMITTGGIVVMGRKTYESIGFPLPERFNIIISRKDSFSGENICSAASIKESLEIISEISDKYPKGIFICGGGQLYKEFLPLAERIYLTEIYENYEGDTFFPEFDKDIFKLTSRKKHPEKGFDFCVYDKLDKDN